MLKFSHREPIGSSTYPMPDRQVDFDKTLNVLSEDCPTEKSVSTIYIHIPFCDQICSFCGFNKAVSGEDVKEQYVKALIKEMDAYSEKKYVQGLEIGAVYLGGGTPNSLSPAQIKEILDAVRTKFPLAKDCEITSEGTPQNFTPERNDALLAGGVNRVSAGIQTFNRDIRIAQLHMNSGKDELLGYIEAIKADFPNFNLDMIYNLPNQTDEIWQDDLLTAINSGSRHLTVYPLVLLEQTIFYADYVKKGKYEAPGEDREIDLYRRSVQALANSEYQDYYSVRDWAKPGFECRYIRLNAENNQVLAFGAGAHGYVAGQTYRNIRATGKYISSILKDEIALPLEAQHFATDYEEQQRHMVMGLRLNHFDTSRFSSQFGVSIDDAFGEKLKTLTESGYLIRDHNLLEHTESGLIWGNNLRTYFESGAQGRSVGYTDTLSIGETGKDHYSKITRIKAAGDVEANIVDIKPSMK